MHRSFLLCSTVVGLALATPAFAQTSGQPATADAAQEVVVTGSRIQRTDLTSVQPVSAISATEIHDRGFTNLADIIHELPDAGAGITPAGPQNSFGTGRNYVDLFSLGSNRTLTLVNGNRFVGDNPPSLFANEAGTQVDINALPTLFVDGIEEVPATGAAVYGSDAVAGVVNIKMKRRYVGAEVDAQEGISRYGDDPHSTLEFAVGRNFLNDRLNVAVDVMFDKTSSLTYADRPRTAEGYAFVPNPADTGPNDGIPATILVPHNRFSGVTEGGLPFAINPGAPGSETVGTPGNPNGFIYLPGTNTPVQFGKNGNLVAFDPGALYGNFNGGTSSGGDSLALESHESLQAPLNRHVADFIASYDFGPHLKAYLNVFYSDNHAVEKVQQPNYSAFAFNGGYVPQLEEVYPGLAFRVASDNAFLTPQAKSVLQANGVGDFILSRANTDITPDPVRSTDRTLDASIDFEGDFTALNRTFNWSAVYLTGNSHSSFDQDNIVFGNSALGIANRFAYALDSVIGPGGTPVCRVQVQNPGSTNPDIANCQPLNPFGVGNASAASQRYVTADFGNKAANDEEDAVFNINTTLFKAPAGDVKILAGYEYRRESAGFNPSLASQEGIGYSIPLSAQSGAYHTNEYFFEGSLPVFSPTFNLPGLYKLEFDGAYRKVDNSLAGNNEAWNYGVRYSPIQDLTFRASRSKTFRAPAITELFASGTSAYDSGADPCQASNITAGPNPTARQANCLKAFQQLGLTQTDLNNFTDSFVGDFTIPVTAVGNSQLKNEVGQSWTYGLVVQPRFVPGLAFSVDYVHIGITNAIEFFGVGNLLESCYDTPGYPSASCGDFTRDSSGQVTTANETYINAGYVHFAAAKFSVTYDRDINRLPYVNTSADLGRIGLVFNATNTRRYITSASGLGFDAINSAGTIDQPRWRWNAEAIYSNGPLRLEWITHYIGPSTYDLTFTNENQSILKVGNNLTHDLSIQYKIRPWLTARLNVQNITDAKPPFPVSGVGFYDEIGRYFLFGLSGKF